MTLAEVVQLSAKLQQRIQGKDSASMLVMWKNVGTDSPLCWDIVSICSIEIRELDIETC